MNQQQNQPMAEKSHQPQVQEPLTPQEPKSKSGVKTAFIIIIALVIVIIAAFAAYYLYIIYTQPDIEPEPIVTPAPQPHPSEPIAELAFSKKLIDPAEFEFASYSGTAKAAQYDLPLDLNQVDNWSKIQEQYNLSSEAVSKLQQNGFVAIDSSNQDDFANFYSNLKYDNIPLFITSDSLLHYYHIFFDTTLMKLERDLFYDDVWQMTEELLAEAEKNYQSTTGDLQEAAKRNVAYLSVALEVLKPKNSQIVGDTALREEYCSEYMDEETCDMFVEGVKSQYGDQPSYKYFSQDEAQKYSFNTPEYVKDIVDQELALIDAHQGWEFSPIFIYEEDYSQYVPRGHYTKSEKLKNYFKSLMWYGRMTALIKGSPSLDAGQAMCTGPMDGIISEYDAKIQTLQASLIAQKFLTSQQLQNTWQRMYAITAFFAGFSDDLGPYEYASALKNVFGDEISVTELENQYDQIKAELDKLTYNPKIYSGLGKCQLFMPCPPLTDNQVDELKVQAAKLLAETKGFRLMGQRFVVDSYFFSEIVSPYSGQYTGELLPLPTEELPLTYTWNDDYDHNRPFSWVKTEVAGCPEGREVKGFPMGLDVMAVFGSDQAKEIIKEQGDDQYSDYQKKFAQLEQEINQYDQEDWTANLYNNWLYSLQALLTDYNDGYPTFMKTSSWEDKQLNTALASWVELRHDTILYVKQSYTMAELGSGGIPEVAGYVEPVPEFYTRLFNLTELTNQGLSSLIPKDQYEELGTGYALDRFASMIDKLITITSKELDNEPLDGVEYNYIAEFGSMSRDLIETISGGEIDEDVLKSVMIADVHTEGNVELVLEEGVGYIKTILVAYKLPDDRILIGVGPGFSYYEFKQSMENRLTDEAWRTMLESGNHPDQPGWVNSFTE